MADSERPGPREAREALDGVQAMERAGRRAAMPPRWMTAIAAVYGGGMSAAQAIPDPPRDLVIIALSVLFLGGLIAKRRTMLAWKRRAAGAGTLLLALLALVVVIAVFIAGQTWQERYGVAWAPVAAGALIAVLVLLLGEAMRARLARPRRPA